MSKEAYYRFKIILIGAGAVGKTSLVKRFVDDTFSTSYNVTIGVDFLSKDVNLDGKEVRLTIWDVGGQERFQFMRSRFYDGAHGALLIFDLSRAETYQEIQKWLNEFRTFAGENVPFILIGNKVDLIEDIGEVVERAEARSFAENEGSIYIDTSAKTGENVEDAFQRLTKLLVKD
jgi:small GTP-binding protein